MSLVINKDILQVAIQKTLTRSFQCRSIEDVTNGDLDFFCEMVVENYINKWEQDKLVALTVAMGKEA